jgi:hopanoid biosynthesis associated RND transporter like protein HpnN
MKHLTDDNLVARVLGWLARAVFRYRVWFVYPQLVLAGFCVFYTVKNLQFDTRRDNLVGANKTYHQNFLRFKKEFPTQDDLVVVVESEDAEKSRQFVERLGAKLEAETNLFKDVFYKGDLKMLGSKALLFVPEPDLAELRRTLQDYQPFIRQFTRATNLVSLVDMINHQFLTASRQANAENEAAVKALPAVERIVRQARDSLHRSGAPPSPGVTALFNPGAAAEQEIYITFGDGRLFLVTAQAPREQLNGPAVERLRKLVEQTRFEVPGLNVGITGEPVLELDEMEQSQRDTTIASIASLVVVALIFIYGYQETGRPVKATFCLLIGLCYTMAFATATIGHLNVLTITFVPILIGLAIDYGVHLISRYEEELRHGQSEEAALIKGMVFTGQGIFTGAFTTAGAFLAMGFTNFKGIQEMGIICGGGLLICLIPMISLLPVLLLRGRQNVMDHVQGDPADRRARIENLWLQRPFVTIAVTGVLSILAATQIGKVYFDYNLLHMQSAGLPAVEFEKKLIYANAESSATNQNAKSVLYAAVIATNLQQAVQLQQQLTNLPAVAGVESITRFLSEDQSRKLGIVRDIKADLESVQFQSPDRSLVNRDELSVSLYVLYGLLGAATREIEKEEPELARQLTSLHEAIERLRVDMLAGTPDVAQRNLRRLTAFQQALFDDIHGTFAALKAQDESSPLRVEDLPAALRNRFVGVTGKYLLMVTPRKDVWDRRNQQELLQQLRKVDRDVTGTPVQLYEYTNLLKSSYEEAAQYSLIAIIILVLVHFRSLLSVVLALVPVALGSLWLGGIMGYFGIPLNPANIMTLPLVIGIGVTNGIHILNRFAEEQTPSILARSTGKAVLVSGLTTIAGFGSLVLGKHQGIQSLGYVMSIGLATCMVSGLTFLPAILNLMVRASARRSEQAPLEEKTPVDEVTRG